MLASALLAFAAVALWPSVASAQTIALNGNYPQRKFTDASGKEITNTRQTRNDDDYAANTGINRGDCDSNEVWQLSFSSSLSLLPTAWSYLEVWASTTKDSCADVSTRAATPPDAPVATARCYRAARFSYGEVINGAVVSIPTTKIVKAIFRLLNDDDPAMTSASDICYPNAGASPVNDQQPTRFYLHFLLIGSDGKNSAPNAATYESAYDTTYDLMGPAPPSDLSLQNGGRLLIARWTGTTSADKDFVEYRAYCFPKMGSETQAPYYGLDAGSFGGGSDASGGADAATDDADAGDESGVDAADTTPASTTDATSTADAGGTCPAQLPTGFAEGQLPSTDIESLNCGSSGTTSGKLTITGLVNGVNYAVAIAAVDKNGNSGLLSNIGCLDPEETRDFYDTYVQDGGQGGGGYCAFGPGAGGGALATLVGLSLATLFVRRARRGGGGR